MLSYVSGAMPRVLRSRSTNVSIGVGLFPNNGGNLDRLRRQPIRGKSSQHRQPARRKRCRQRRNSPRLGSQQHDLGVDCRGQSADSGRPASPTPPGRSNRVVRPAYRLAYGQEGQDRRHHLGRQVRRSPISASATTTTLRPASGRRPPSGSPWGLRAWLAYIKGKGKKLEMAEWGVGRDGDDPAYIQNMTNFSVKPAPR